MTFTIRKFILMLALAVMPLQGAAAVISVIACPTDRPERVVQAMPVQDSHDLDAGHDERSGDTKISLADHVSCHLVVSGPPGPGPQWAIPYSAARDVVSHTRDDLFLPELPQRPPRI